MTCHRNSRPAAGNERGGDGRVAESLEKEEMQDGSTEWQVVVGARTIYKRKMKDCDVEKHKRQIVT